MKTTDKCSLTEQVFFRPHRNSCMGAVDAQDLTNAVTFSKYICIHRYIPMHKNVCSPKNYHHQGAD